MLAYSIIYGMQPSKGDFSLNCHVTGRESNNFFYILKKSHSLCARTASIGCGKMLKGRLDYHRSCLALVIHAFCAWIK